MFHHIVNANLPTPLKINDPGPILRLTLPAKRLKPLIRRKNPGSPGKLSFSLQRKTLLISTKKYLLARETPQDTEPVFGDDDHGHPHPAAGNTKCRNPIQYMVWFTKPLVVLNNDL